MLFKTDIMYSKMVYTITKRGENYLFMIIINFIKMITG